MTAETSPARSPRRPIYAWAIYDWANSAFATVVLAGFFPILFRDYFSAGREDADITLALGIANSVGAAIIILLAPFVGALSDAYGRRKLPLAFCVITGALATAALAYLDEGAWRLAAMVYVVATVAFSLGNVFYDALLNEISRPRERAFASVLGFALGYLGGGLLLLFLVYMVFEAAAFGFASHYDVMLFGLTATALWWLVFSAPLAAFVAERRRSGRLGEQVKDGARRLLRTWRDLRGNKTVMWFLVAYILYIDGVDTIIRMAVNYGQTLGFGATDLIAALLLVQFVGFPATLAYSPLERRFGARALLLFLIAAYIGVTIAAAFMMSFVDFVILAAMIGLFQGGIQAISRSYFSQLIPNADAARFFGLYNLIGKAAVFLGPATVGIVGFWSSEMAQAVGHTGFWSDGSRVGVLSIALFLIAGGWVLWRKVPATAK